MESAAAREGTWIALFCGMDVSATRPEQMDQLDPDLQRTCARRNIKLSVLHSEDGRVLIILRNRKAAAAYRAEPGWPEKFRQNLDSGLFG